jgi:hypothetical protein
MSEITKTELLNIQQMIENDLKESQKMFDNKESQAKIIGYLEASLKMVSMYNKALIKKTK